MGNKTMNNEVTGKFVRKIRGEDNQIAFANSIKISQPRLSKIEKGVHPLSMDVAYNLFKFAKVDPKELFEIFGKSLKENIDVQQKKKARPVSNIKRKGTSAKHGSRSPKRNSRRRSSKDT